MAKRNHKNSRKPSSRPVGTFFLVQFTANGETLWTGRRWTEVEKQAKHFPTREEAFAYAEKSRKNFPETFVVEKFGDYFEDLTHGQVGIRQAA